MSTTAPETAETAAESPKLGIRYLPLSKLIPAAENAKQHDIDAIRRSFSEFGCADVVALLDERTGKMYAGHGRKEALEAMKADGEAPPLNVMPGDNDWLVPVGVGWRSLSDDHARALNIGHNETTIAGGWDLSALAEQLSMIESDHLRAIAGFDDERHAALLADLTKTVEPPDPTGDVPKDNYQEQYGVIVMCESEDEQQRTFEDLQAHGFKCRIVVT